MMSGSNVQTFPAPETRRSLRLKPTASITLMVAARPGNADSIAMILGMSGVGSDGSHAACVATARQAAEEPS